jgi:hypothetical protein
LDKTEQPLKMNEYSTLLHLETLVQFGKLDHRDKQTMTVMEWNTSWFDIDKTKLYRFSVWVRRTSATAGENFILDYMELAELLVLLD